VKKIVIKTCKECPHIDHNGAFGQVAYIPMCRWENKKLPYTVNVEHRGKAIRNVASPSHVIPDWCSLENNV